jgi:hypothetical protein
MGTASTSTATEKALYNKPLVPTGKSEALLPVAKRRR